MMDVETFKALPLGTVLIFKRRKLFFVEVKISPQTVIVVSTSHHNFYFHGDTFNYLINQVMLDYVKVAPKWVQKLYEVTK